MSSKFARKKYDKYLYYNNLTRVLFNSFKINCESFNEKTGLESLRVQGLMVAIHNNFCRLKSYKNRIVSKTDISMRRTIVLGKD